MLLFLSQLASCVNRLIRFGFDKKISFYAFLLFFLCFNWIIILQVYTEVVSLVELCRVQLKVAQLNSNMQASDLVG